MWRRALLPAALLALLAGSADARTLRHPSAQQLRPRAFASCPALVRYARRHFAVTRGVPEPPLRPLAEPVPVGRPTPPAAAAPQEGGATPPFSTTNNQEEGVDEPDIAKTNGSTIFTVAGTTLYAVAVDGPAPRLVGSLDLGTSGYGAQLLLRGDRLIVVSGPGPVPLGTPVAIPARAYVYGGSTVVTEVDVHDRSAMRVARTMTIDGTFVDARQNGSTARLVISSAPPAIADASGRATASGWVPRRRFRSHITTRHYVRPVAPCDRIRRPVRFSGLGTLTILTIDLDRGLWAADSDALMADAQVVYGSPTSLYVATQKWVDPQTPVDRLPASQTTVIHRFDVTDPDATRLVSSGEVPGYLLNQFSLSEYQGRLRVATTSRPIWWNGQPPPGTSQSFVTVLAERGGVLAPIGQVSGLGRGEQIYSVRFLDTVGYVVTFHQVDPLFTIDLSSPTAPRVAGQLELSGYSAYLHPVGRGLLLGIGSAVGSGNEPSATQLELFDVGDPAAPKLLQRTTLGDGSSSEVAYDHHAFLFWPPTGLAVLPVQVYSAQPDRPDRQQGFVGAIGFHVARSGIAEVGRVEHDPVAGSVPAIRRSIVIGDRLFTISDAGVMASGLSALDRRAFVAFPAPPPPG